MSLCQTRACIISAATAIGLLYAVAARPTAAADAPAQREIVRYHLSEEWSVAAQGPVHLREKRVRSNFQLDATDLGVDASGQRTIELHFVQVAVEADIPAQKRMGAFDSENPPEEFALEHHELAGPIALLGQTLRLTFATDGTLTAIGGTDGASRRLDEMYDASLRGSEQDLHTRDIERRKISPEGLCRSWADVFVGHKADRTQTDQPLERPAEAVFMACIPSESWMTHVAIPVAETVQFAPCADGGAKSTRRPRWPSRSSYARRSAASIGATRPRKRSAKPRSKSHPMVSSNRSIPRGPPSSPRPCPLARASRFK